MEQLTDKPLLEFANVTFGYGNNQDKVLQNVSFSIFPGDQIGILGDNGSGKSTIIKILLGLYSPEQGKVSLFDQKVSWKKHYPKLGYIGDPSYNLGELGLPTSLSVKNVVEIFKLLWKQSNQYLPSCDDIEQRLNIPNFYSCNIGKLSKGQRMRLNGFFSTW
ncbi:ATP-binding cassette domain-containing protein [Planktothrix prolifica]|uniref:ATP-binding cassette domain-containing protein n=1 Tax=Planktothrix prolifica TaxID=54307 RepID=UPI000403FC9A|nr:ATP-binding cassette domain-containing protein [Planktothrix prolifica]